MQCLIQSGNAVEWHKILNYDRGKEEAMTKQRSILFWNMQKITLRLNESIMIRREDSSDKE